MPIKETIRKHFWRYVFAALLIVLIVLLGWLIFDVRNLYRGGMLRPTRGFRGTYIHEQPSNPNQIQVWMTFSYVNRIFNLPADYLSTALALQDSRYPNITISQYAKTKNLNDADFLKQVQDSVNQYLQGAH